jgi:hypothetical protein
MSTEERSRQERVAEQTEIRLAMLRNGYTPLGSECKAVKIKNWSRLDVTEKLIERWGWRDDLVTSGVRVDAPLVVMDFDIDDAATIDKVFAAIEAKDAELGRALAAAPCRFGGGDKLALFLRSEDGVRGTWHSKAYYRPWDMESDAAKAKLQRLEVFGAGRDGEDARYMATNGVHTLGPDGVVLREYVWEDARDLSAVSVGDLPAITQEQVLLAVDTASEVLHAVGWVYEVSSKIGRAVSAIEYALVPGMEFRTSLGETVDLAGLEEICDVHDLRVCMDFIQAGSQNVTRGLVGRSPADGRVYVFDTASRTRYRPADLDVRRKVDALGARLAAPVVGDGGDCSEGGMSRLEALAAAVPEESRLFGGPMGASEEQAAEAAEQEAVDAREFVVRHLLDRFAYWSDGSGYVVDIGGGPEKAMSMSSFRNLMLPWSWKQKRSKRANAAEDTINPADVWLCHPERKVVGGYRFVPVSRERLVEVRGETFVNIWERPRWWDDGEAVEGDGEAVQAFQKFLAHLIPDERERDWFVMWLAAKVQRPWIPNCGVLMVAERQGSGRGTLFDMLGVVFGQRHVKPVSAVQLIGGGSQSQYTDWLESALLVTCDEVLAGDDAGGAMAWKRREVYERLKALVDPRGRWGSIVRKGLPNYETEIYASYLLATNNPNALPLSVDDRRFAVVTNTTRKLVWDEELMALLDPWRCDLRKFSDAFGAGVFGWLAGVTVDWSGVRESPTWMAGREAMLDANESDLDAALDSVLRRIDGDYVLGHHLRERLGRALEAGGMLGEVKGWWNKAQDVLSRPNRMGWRKMQGRHRFDVASAQGSMTVATVFYREDGAGVDAWMNTPPAARRALWEGGEAGAKSSGRKVAEKLAERGLTVVQGGTPAE